MLTTRFVSTGIAALDDLLGGGFPVGKITDIFSPRWEACGPFVEALRATVPGPLVTTSLTDLRAAVLGAARKHKVVYVALDRDLTCTSQAMNEVRLLASQIAARPVAVVFLAGRQSDESLFSPNLFGRLPSATRGVDPIRLFAHVSVRVSRADDGFRLLTVKNKLTAPFRAVHLSVEGSRLVPMADHAMQGANEPACAAILDAVRVLGPCTMSQAVYKAHAEWGYVDAVAYGSSMQREFDRMVDSGLLTRVGYCAGHPVYRIAPLSAAA